MNTFTAPQMLKMYEDLDPVILDRVRKGDKNSIELIKSCLMSMTYKICRQYGIKNYDLAKEIVNEVIVEIVTSKKTFTPPFNVMGYLHHIAKSLICRHLRNSIPIVGQEIDSANLVDINPQVDSGIANYEALDVAEVCKKYLNEQELIFINGIFKREATETLMTLMGYRSKDAFYSRKSQIVAKFRKLLRKNGIDF